MTGQEKENFINYYHIPESSYFRSEIERPHDEIQASTAVKASMAGIVRDLTTLKKEIKDIWQHEFYGVTYSAYESAYFGWHGEKRNNHIKLGRKIDDNILSLYATILVGLFGKNK